MALKFAGIALCAVLLAATTTPSVGDTATRDRMYEFPRDFLFGAATASYQIEGAWDEDGKSENIWDHLTHTSPCTVRDCSNGDVAADSYHQVERDVRMMREMGLDFYRFSLSWTRILPTGFPDYINQPGVDYYNRLIDEMLKYGIQPMVTIFHWDLPQKLQNLGGFTNPHIVDWFGDYADVVFQLFGDRVKYWITFNEPREYCLQGHGDTLKAPMLNITGYAEYLCGKNLLVAHARAYRIYQESYKEFGGEISIAFSQQWLEPATEDDVEAAEDSLQFDLGFYAHPIFKGNFPQVVIDKVAAKSREQGFLRSRLPEFTAEEVEYVKGTADYFGLNHYTTFLIDSNPSTPIKYAVPSYMDDIGVAVRYQSNEWTFGATDWNAMVPWGFRKLLNYIKAEYDDPRIYVTENGFSTPPGSPSVDTNRVTFYREYLRELSLAIEEDGVNVQMYAAWSLMDNFEWMWGYTCLFGLYEVDFTSPLRTRSPRYSALIYRDVVSSHLLNMTTDPTPPYAIIYDDVKFN